MANGFKIKQSGEAQYQMSLKAWEYRFHVHHDDAMSDMTATFFVSDSIPESGRYDEAKKYMKAFVQLLSAAVAAR